MKQCILFLLYSFLLTSLGAQEVSLSVAQQALLRAQDLHQRDSLAAAYCQLGEYYAYRNSDSARYFFQQGLKVVRQTDTDAYCTLLVNEAETYFSTGDLDEAARKFQHALHEVIRLQHEVSFQVSILGSLGVIYRRQEQPDSALACYTRALEVLEPLDEPDDEIFLLTNIAILYANTERMEQAGYYIEEAMKQADSCQDLDMVMYAGASAGAIFGHLKQYERSLGFLRQVMQKAQREQKPRFVLKSMTYMLAQYQKLGMKDSVQVYLSRAQQVAATLPEANTEVQGFRELQYQVLSYLGRYRESLAVLYKLLDADLDNAQVSRGELYYQLARNYVLLREFEQAAKCYELARVQTDSLQKQAFDRQLSEWTVKYQTQEKEMEIVRLQQEHTVQQARVLRWSMVAVVLTFLLLMVVVYSLVRRKQRKKVEELKLAQRYIEGLEQERERLAKDLHDGVCNDLLGVGMQFAMLPADESSRQEVLRLLEGIRQEVRSISHELMPPKFQQLTLRQTVEAYLDRWLHAALVEMDYRIEGEGDWQRLPDTVAYETYRILQECLSNICKYAGATRIEVVLKLDVDKLTLDILNNGSPLPSASPTVSGIGLLTIQERVKSLDGQLTLFTREEMQVFRLSVPVYAGKP